MHGNAMSGTVPLDLASLLATSAPGAVATLNWPTSYDEYGFLSKGLVDSVVSAARTAARTPELEAVVEAKLYDTATDLGVIARLALDLQCTRRSGRRPVYNSESSAWLAFLDASATDATRIASQMLWHHGGNRSLLSELKRNVRRYGSDLAAAVGPKPGRHDILSHNHLLDEFYGAGAIRTVDISPNYRTWPTDGGDVPALHELIAMILDAFQSAAAPAIGDDRILRESMRALAGPVVAGHMKKAWSDLQAIRRVYGAGRAGEVLAGGTPKHIGRLIAWHYREMGRPVRRFGHGGERAFYDDYVWSLAELPFCDRYYCHSDLEARSLSRRRAEGRMASTGLGEIEFVGLGSRRHWSTYLSQAAEPSQARSGTVMYVAGGYLGEAIGDFPSRKPPDALYYEWQVWLLKTLRALGHRVAVKVHPKGLFNDAMALRAYCDEVVGGLFDVGDHRADCYIFDFAGTAFFDALASNRGIVLADMGVRPRDPHAFAELASRCEIVTCDRAEGNRFRLDEDALGTAVEQASDARTWPADFFRDCFGN